jgi:signal transduction histidine kinase
MKSQNRTKKQLIEELEALYKQVIELKGAERKCKQTEEKLYQRNKYLAALHETTLGLMNRLELNNLLEAIIKRAGELIGTSDGSIWLVEPGEAEMKMHIGVGTVARLVGFQLKPGEGLFGRIWQTGQPLAIADYCTWPERFSNPILDIYHATVGIPLKSGSKVIGAIGLTSLKEDQVFGEDEIALLNQFAELASIALDNAKLYTSVQRELAERKWVEEKMYRQKEYLAALHEATLGLMNRLELNDLLQAIIIRAGALLGTPHGFIYLVEQEKRELTVKVRTGLFSKLITQRLGPGEGLSGKVWQTGQPLIVGDYRAWQGRLPDSQLDIFCSMAGIPLKSGSQVVGVIGLAYLEENRIFGDEEIELLSRFAALASIALDNAWLYTKAQRELAMRKQAEKALKKAKEALELKVSERTIELKRLNEQLLIDITQRKQAEKQLKLSQKRLRELSRHLESVREEERAYIAREIHDELGQTLTGFKMDLSWLESRLSDNQKPLIEKIQSMSNLIDTTMHTVRRISTQLRPSILDTLGLVAAIQWQAQEFQNRMGINCRVIIIPKDISVDRDLSTTIFRIFQETLTNVARHARATRVHIKLKKMANNLILEVRDNGKGITKSQISSSKSLGLIGIRERALLWGGEVNFKSVREEGTTVIVRIPFPGYKQRE